MNEFPYYSGLPNPNIHTWTIPATPPSLVPDMTLRDYFAGQVLAGIYARVDSLPKYAARDAYAVADEMLKERGGG